MTLDAVFVASVRRFSRSEPLKGISGNRNNLESLRWFNSVRAKVLLTTRFGIYQQIGQYKNL